MCASSPSLAIPTKRRPPRPGPNRWRRRIAKGVAITRNPERHRRMEEIAAQFADYRKGIEYGIRAAARPRQAGGRFVRSDRYRRTRRLRRADCQCRAERECGADAHCTAGAAVADAASPELRQGHRPAAGRRRCKEGDAGAGRPDQAHGDARCGDSGFRQQTGVRHAAWARGGLREGLPRRPATEGKAGREGQRCHEAGSREAGERGGRGEGVRHRRAAGHRSGHAGCDRRDHRTC